MAKYYLFVGFENQKVKTMILSTSEDERNAMDCDRYVQVDNPENIKKNVIQWLEDKDNTA